MNTKKINIRKLEADLWESADLLRAGSKLTSSQYCMPVLAMLFLRYAYSRYKMVEQEIMANRPMRNGRAMPIEAADFQAKSALFLPKEAQFDYLVNLPDNIATAELKTQTGLPINSLGEAVNNAMTLVEAQSEQLTGILPKTYTMFSDDLLRELLRIFNNKTLDEIGGDVIGRIYEYFLSKFAKAVASDDGVFFTPKSLVKMLVNVLEPKHGIMLDPACGSGGMFVQTGDFVNEAGMNANQQMTFYGQEKVEYNAQLCQMNMAVHGLNGKILSGDEANSFYHDAHHLEGKCDYVMVSVGNNFFYTLSLPCSLWFFDRNKSDEIRNKVLFIDARNYYTVVDRTLNEWSEWQQKNLNAIVWLYRGETKKYQHLIQEYQEFLKEALGQMKQKVSPSFSENLVSLNAYQEALKKDHKLSLEAVDKNTDMKAMAKKKEQKRLTAEFDEQMAWLDGVIKTCEEAIWLTDKFGYEGKYQDVLGLCKIATIEEIAEKNYSLTPGAYVGVAEAEDDGVEFAPRMKEIHEELAQLHAEANRLMDDIQKTWEGLV